MENYIQMKVLVLNLYIVKEKQSKTKHYKVISCTPSLKLEKE